MKNSFDRGNSPGRARDDLERHEGFKRGHKKFGGRKKGTPNAIPASYKRAMLEATHRLGSDGNGKDGGIGYFSWVAKQDLTVFYVDVWSHLLEVEEYEAAMGVRSTCVTIDQVPPKRRLLKKRTKPFAWLKGGDNAHESLVQDLMRIAVTRYKIFCKMIVAAFLTPPKNWRERVARSQRYLNDKPCSPIIVRRTKRPRAETRSAVTARHRRDHTRKSRKSPL
jgi:hypothetical protein